VSAEGITRVHRRGNLVMPNGTVYDTSLSYTALGVLAVLLARPDDAPKGYRTLMRPAAGVGQKSILSAFRELRAGGYRYQFLRTVTTPDGNKVFTDTYIYDEPVPLEMAKQHHFTEHGVVAIEIPDRRKSKGTLAVLRGAHERDAHERDAHERRAQETGSAGVLLSGSPKTVEQINQGPTAAETAPSKPYLGITPEQMEKNQKGAAAARAALRKQKEEQ
jgi:hypothetical protein